MAKRGFYDNYIQSIIHKAKILDIKQEEILKFVREGWKNEHIKY